MSPMGLMSPAHWGWKRAFVNGHSMYLLPLQQQDGCQRSTQTSRQSLHTRQHSKNWTAHFHRTAKRSLHTAGKPVDWGEGEGADVKGVAGIIIQLHRVAPALFTCHHDLLRLSCHLQGTWQARSAVFAPFTCRHCHDAVLHGTSVAFRHVHDFREQRGTQGIVELLPKLYILAEMP